MAKPIETITDAPSQGALSSKESLVMQVCPFCGAIAEKVDEACRRCRMENTALTRQATRARIGPWFVMQARNPSAPGMKLGTLLALIRKGQVTAKSVVRGPTTHQLWRFAARVKGISREFGLCYSCGSEVDRSATACPRCSRSQDLPANPESLLETEASGAKPLYTEERPSEPRLEKAIEAASESRPALREPVARPAVPTIRTVSQPPSATTTMSELAEIPSPELAPPDMQSRPRQQPRDGVLSPRELAAAFSLQYDPKIDIRTGRPRRSPWRMAVAALILLGIGGGSVAVYMSPVWRQKALSLVRQAYPPASSGTDSPHSLPTLKAYPAKPDPLPDWANSPVTNTPSAIVPKASTDGAITVSNSELPSTSQNADPDNAAGGKKVRTAGLSQVPPTVTQTPAVQSHSETIVKHASSETSTSAAAATAEKLRQQADGDLDTLAMELRSNGLEAESRHDYVAAQYFYQQVENLPRDHWPGGIDDLLKQAQQMSVASDLR